jgi:hypothetical protein
MTETPQACRKGKSVQGVVSGDYGLNVTTMSRSEGNCDRSYGERTTSAKKYACRCGPRRLKSLDNIIIG